MESPTRTTKKTGAGMSTMKRRRRRTGIATTMIALSLLHNSVMDAKRAKLINIGPEPHEYTKDEGQKIAHQIATQRNAKQKRG